MFHILNFTVMKKTALLIPIMLCCAACNNEIDLPQEIEEAGRQIELFVHDADVVSVYSTATMSECMIDTVWVLVFDKDSAKRWVEKIGRSRIMNNGQATQLLPQLKHKLDNGDIVICIANVASNPDTAAVTPSTINACFPMSFRSYYLGGDYLPMYGEIKSWSAAGAYTCRMIRAVAKVQVQLGPSFSSTVSDFNAENVVYYICENTAISIIQPQSTPNILFSGVSTRSFNNRFLQKADVTERQASIFIHEYQSSIYDRGVLIDKKIWNTGRTYIVLAKGSGADMKYYRLDFYDHARSEFLDVLRNHHYLFTINSVRSEGYEGEALGAQHAGSNLET
jgi:hypothetical protein